MEMTEGSYRQLDPDGVNRPSMDKHKETDTGPLKRAAVCLGVLCALLLSAIALLSFKMMENKQLQTSYKEKLQMQSGYDNMTIEYKQLQITYNNLKTEKSQLQNSNSNLSREKLQLQSSYDSLNEEKSGLQTRNDRFTSEKPGLQTRNYRCTSEKSSLQSSYNSLLREKSQLQTGYNNLTEENSQLQTSYNNLNKEKPQLQTSYNNLNREKSQLQTSYNNPNTEKFQLQDKFHTMAAEKDKLQKRLCNPRMEITKYAVDVTLDPDTAENNLILSADGKQVRHVDSPQNLPDNPQRFDPVVNVLGKQGFTTGRFYYEVEVSGKTAWDLGVARESSNRKGRISLSPENGYWTIWLKNGDKYEAIENPSVLLSLKEKPERVAVFVDYEAGLVSFYDPDRWNLIHSFRGVSFKEKIYPFFSPSTRDGGKNSSPLIIITPISCPN
ncbi:nuclear factor 7, ovary-like isoform X3 [Clupea harengus]|uniref:Nuclear factor 7, ovary-like isoform X3 n=1 Tax=Clupea harengus TaxID=7950 RepID=A0A6P8GY70_CLUHA|nr:nuclear factor 7, ovary-like isoform X3 [Clupea harengus]